MLLRIPTGTFGKKRLPEPSCGRLSPNLWLYGSTTNIPAAAKRGVSICLGSDWGPSGTRHVLAELKVAKLVSRKQEFGLEDRELVAMVTSNAGDILSRCWPRRIGRLLEGSFGDVTVLRPRGNGDVWSQIVNATEREVLLVVVGGQARYGDTDAMAAATAGPATSLKIGGRSRKLAIPDPKDNKKAWKWTDITSLLDKVREDPAGALHHAEERRRSFAGLMAAAEAPLQLTLDMPVGGVAVFAAQPPDPSKVEIPPLPSLVHDKPFFHAIHGHGFHGGLLDELADFYTR